MPDMDMDAMRAAIRGHLSAPSAAHCERTAATARELAHRFDVDPDAAELAGLLHDWSRDDSAEDLIAFADANCLAVLPEERENPYLLHSRVAAEELRKAYPDLSLQVLSAVAAHTVGAVPMTPLDEVVYVADAMEPARAYPGVEELRARTCGSSLDAAFADAYARSVAFVREKGLPLHPMTALVAAEIERATGESPLSVPSGVK